MLEKQVLTEIDAHRLKMGDWDHSKPDGMKPVRYRRSAMPLWMGIFNLMVIPVWFAAVYAAALDDMDLNLSSTINPDFLDIDMKVWFFGFIAMFAVSMFLEMSSDVLSDGVNDIGVGFLGLTRLAHYFIMIPLIVISPFIVIFNIAALINLLSGSMSFWEPGIVLAVLVTLPLSRFLIPR